MSETVESERGRLEAAGALHRGLPPDAAFSIHETRRTRAGVDYAGGVPFRPEPPAYEEDREWLVVVMCPAGAVGAYVESTAGTSLDEVVAEAVERCRAWDRAGRPARATDRPAPLVAPGSAARRDEPRRAVS